MPGVVTIKNENNRTIMKIEKILDFLRLKRLTNLSIYEAATNTRNTDIKGNHRLVRRFLIPSKGIP
jgi:ribosomal protein L30/L7E